MSHFSHNSQIFYGIAGKGNNPSLYQKQLIFQKACFYDQSTLIFDLIIFDNQEAFLNLYLLIQNQS